jgi:AcrR family transcriptional regulator
MSRKTKTDWFMEAKSILEANGHTALTIDLMTERLGLTKGSFYHHFGNYQGFKLQFLAFAEAQGTQAVIEHVLEGQTPLTQLTRLFEVVSQRDGIELALRTWALSDSEVADYQARIDAQRIGFLKEVYLSVLGDPQQAQHMAHLSYSVYVGAQHLAPPIEGAELRYLLQLIHRVYGIGDNLP